jgi:cholesterol transport system auxiliary component
VRRLLIQRLAGALGIAAAMGLLAGCASNAPPATFDIAAPSEGLGSRPGRALIVVAEPSALQALDTNRVMVMTRSGIAYLGGVQWADRVPKLLQVRLIQTFENARRLTAVGRPGDRLLPAAQINSEIRRFGIDEVTGEAVIEISVKIVNDRSGRILAGQIFTKRVPGAGTEGASAAAALDLAAQSVLREIVAWVSSRI